MIPVISLANQKGGTGKTTTALNLGAGLAALGKRILLIDLDPQASLSLATVGESSGSSMAEVMGDAKPGKTPITKIIQSISPGLDIAPSDIALSNTELYLPGRNKNDEVLKRALAGLSGYDLVIIDTGPSLGKLVINALTASQGIICPATPTALDLRGVALFIESLNNIRAEGLNEELELLGVLLTQYDQRIKLHQAAIADMQAGGIPLLPMRISRSVKAAATAGAGQPLDRGNLAEQYKELAEYVNRWLTKKKKRL